VTVTRHTDGEQLCWACGTSSVGFIIFLGVQAVMSVSACHSDFDDDDRLSSELSLTKCYFTLHFSK